ncbi:hypothetical protein Poli38472_013339 [Pythium oligandrum]|uniref:Uncharacterized protein n=1 Tax=Pythium oligandrum TaxID=41045 RepID=A0A8K1C7H3_PYTOL|nr:hypothetical protein Poli38472_013339 [Pythium oligandrum]|eukprot:TMW57865.1 hypothetical protein Poli38472_013339 [Pythium oligandrum]
MLYSLSAEETLHRVDIALCVPVVLIMNFSLFQYLVTTFHRRRQERRVRLLLTVAFLSFASLIPFAFPNSFISRDLNDISEVCSVLTFLLQITILTRDVNRRIKIRSIWSLMWIGETLVVVSLGTLVLNFIDLFEELIPIETVELLNDMAEFASLLFIVCFRFYFLALAKGMHKVFITQKTEIVVYVLFLTHSAPFLVLDHFTALNWRHVQGLYMRITIALCLWTTIKARISSKSSKRGWSTLTGGTGPGVSNLDSKFSKGSAVPVKLSKVPQKKHNSVSVAPYPMSAPTVDKLCSVG